MTTGALRNSTGYESALTPQTNGEIAQAKILDALVCPVTGGPLHVFPEEVAGAAIRRGVIQSRSLGTKIGRIENFQIDFVRLGDAATPKGGPRPAGPLQIDSVAEWRLVSHSAPEIRYSGATIPVEDYDVTVVEETGATISFEASGEIELLLFAHPWSGVAEIGFLGRMIELDLYAPHTDIPRPVKLDLGPAPARVEIRVTGRKNELSAGRQCVFGGFRQQTGRFVPLRHRKRAKVRGAAFDEAFARLLAGVPETGLLLDVGGGNRQVDDPRYVNVDYADYPEPDLIADATKLPLRDACVDAVYSTGVFEHISDPLKAGAEVTRVLKPGGKAVIGWAFMQPIHSEGQHYYNATPWGVTRAFSGLKPVRFWYDNSFSYLVRWGASVSGLDDLVPAAEIDAVCATLSRWDALIPESHRQFMANGVWCEFAKA